MWERYGGEGFADGAVPMLLPCCWGAAAGREVAERNLHGAVTMLFAAVGVQLLGREVAERNLRTVLLPCYLQLLGVDVGERDCGDESADGAVTMVFAAVGGRCWGVRLRR